MNKPNKPLFPGPLDLDNPEPSGGDRPKTTTGLANLLELDDLSDSFDHAPAMDTLNLDDLSIDEIGAPPVPPRGGKTIRMNIPPLPPGPIPGAARASMPPPPPPGSQTAAGTIRQMPVPPGVSPPPAPSLKVSGGLLGKILVENNLITEQQRDFVLKLQMQSGHSFRFGELAVKQGFLSETDLQRALDAQKKYVKVVHSEQSRMVRLPEEVAKVGGEIARSTADASKMTKWLASALKYGASDLHLMTGQPLVLRHMGRLVKSKEPPLTAEDTKKALLSILSDEHKEILEKKHAVVHCFDLKGGGRVRGSIYKHMNGYNGTFRIIPSRVPSLVSLHLPSQIAKFTTYAQGLVLITGPIGCGKTTTMAALVDIVNQERQEHIITVERPIEFVHQNARSLVTQREVGVHTNTFSVALRAALREDPDVIAVGEMNDIETARLAVTAAETGHLVFATLHTENAVRTINRVLDIFPPDEQGQVRSMLSESLRGVICQRLVGRSDEPGQIPAVEMLFTTPAMRNLIREQKVHQLPNAIRMSRNIGNQILEDHAKELFEAGQISQETCDRLCREDR